MERVRNESAQLLSLWSEDGSGLQDEVASHQPPDHGQKLVFDNFDFNQKVHHMSESIKTLTTIRWHTCALRTELLGII